MTPKKAAPKNKVAIKKKVATPAPKVEEAPAEAPAAEAPAAEAPAAEAPAAEAQDQPPADAANTEVSE